MIVPKWILDPTRLALVHAGGALVRLDARPAGDALAAIPDAGELAARLEVIGASGGDVRGRVRAAARVAFLEGWLTEVEPPDLEFPRRLGRPPRALWRAPARSGGHEGGGAPAAPTGAP